MNMKQVKTPEELMEFVVGTNHKNSVNQFYIPGKGTFALVLQKEEEQSIQGDVEVNPALEKMIADSREEYRLGNEMTTSDLLKSMSAEDFR